VNTFQRIKRANRIWRFYRVSRLLFWTIWVIYRERRRLIRERERGLIPEPRNDLLVRMVIQFRETAVDLGGVIIKLGQFLSARADLLPDVALKELAQLQDEVRAEPFGLIVRGIERELGKPIGQVFAHIEQKPTAAASLGQVHRGRLPGGEDVAIKVQRPGVDQLVRADLRTLRFVIWVVTHLKDTSKFIDLHGLYREFRRTVYEELDYISEGHNAERFAAIFRNDPMIRVPRVYWDFTTRRLITLEWIDAIKITDYAALEAAEISRLAVAEKLVSTYFHQVFVEGFFHADPHPGNIFVQPGPVITFVDFGMMGLITPVMKRTLRACFVAVVNQDARMLTSSLRDLGFLGPGADLVRMEQALRIMLARFHGLTMQEMARMDPQELFQDIEHLLYDQPFRLPYQFAFLGRAVGTLVGLATGIAPDFNFFQAAAPHARAFMQAQGAQTILDLLRNQATVVGRSMIALPQLTERVLTMLEQGQVHIQMGNDALGHDLQRVARSSDRLTQAIFFALPLAGGITLEVLHQSVAGWFCLGVAALIGVLSVVRRG
jgi:predicted unusual protein kinase regulating ubiquinone biosynthesis (AarF/ABC1/UbiB family)